MDGNPRDSRPIRRFMQWDSSPVVVFSAALLLHGLLIAPARAGSGCVSCHATLGEKHKAVVTAFGRDIHK